jgi:pyruvate,water dikinase
MKDIEHVGGKNASLGELISNLSDLGVNVPGGFATTAKAYWDFLDHEGLAQRIMDELRDLDTNNISQLTGSGKKIRTWIQETPFPQTLEKNIREHYSLMSEKLGADLSVAVRSSATAEDLPDASFAGQQETYLNVRGIENVLAAVKDVFASLYNDRAIAYRVHHGFDHHDVALSAGIQQMVRSDCGASGVMFTLDTESGFREVIFITASYGLGETIVQGAVNPDEFYVSKHCLESGNESILRRTLGSKAIKMVYSDETSHTNSVKTVENSLQDRQNFCLSDNDIKDLAKQAMLIEKHYQRPMDIEWGKDGNTGKLYILQARPETVQSRSGNILERYQLEQNAEILLTGRAIGQRIGAGNVSVIKSIAEMDKMQDGDVLVADMTDPDWEPIMKRAAAIVTNRGGRTCHAAIIAREMGIPAVVGCGNATTVLEQGTAVTVSCAEGDTGNIYAGNLDFVRKEIALDEMPELNVKIMMNVGNPDRAFDFATLPHRGVGLARLEFIINRMIGIHPKALLEFDNISGQLKDTIEQMIAGYQDPVSFYIDKLTEGISTIAAAFHPQPVIVRMSDFKSNEYANLIGGDRYEPHEENPMLGFRGASRYISDEFRECFALECAAIHKVRDEMGLTNVQIMIPFVRTVDEARQVVDLLSEQNLRRGTNDLKLIMMCELPSNALMANEFLEYFDGMSIGSNDMTQLTLGLDRDSGIIAHLFDERDPAVKKMLAMAINACKEHGKYIGICGQGPSDHPDLAEWLLAQGIESMSLNPDTVVETWLLLAGQSVN